MNIAYFGSPQISVQLADSLNIPSPEKIKLVVTQPDKPTGKRLQLTPTPVKAWAMDRHLPVFDLPIRTDDQRAALQNFLAEHDIELGIVFAYGYIIPDSILSSLRHGCWNVHPSLLPRYRGPTPTTFPLLLGDTTIGTSLIQMNARMDEGEIIAQDEIQLNNDAPQQKTQIETMLIDRAKRHIEESLPRLMSGTMVKSPQHHADATYTLLLRRDDGYITSEILKHALAGSLDTTVLDVGIYARYQERNPAISLPELTPSLLVQYMVRALSPWPGVWTQISHGEVKLRVKVLEATGSPTILHHAIVQIEGKTPVNITTFLQSYSL